MNVFSLPKGGTAGQVLAKTSDVDGEAEWVDLSASGALDDAPTQDSENAVKSGGVYTALENKQDELVGVAGQIVGFDADGHAVAQDAATAALPAGVEGQYIGYDVDGNAVAADMDGVPTENSAAAITSGAVFTAMAGKQDTLVGLEGQHVVFDADGKTVAADMPADYLTREVVDALPDPADAVETVIYVLKVVDPDTAAVSYEEYQLVEGALVRMSGEPVDLSNYQEKLAGLENQYVGFDADGKAVAVDLPTGHLTREVIDTMVTADVAEENVEYILKVVGADDPTIVTYQHWALIDGEMVMIGGEDIELPTDHLAYEVVDVLPDVADAIEGKLYILRITDADTGDVSYQEYKLLDGAMVLTSADLSNVQTKLTGLENQYVGFDANGDAVAIDLPVGHLVREVVDALPLVDDASEYVIYILKVVDPDDASVTYEQWQLIEGAFAQVGGAPVELPENHLTREVVDAMPAAADALETVMYVLRVTDADTGAVTYTEHQLIDGAMVQTSADLSGYQEKLTGNAGQMIVIDANGDAVAQDFPEGMLTREVVDVLPDVADAEENVTYILKKDDGAGNITYSEWQLIDGELVQVGGEVTDMSAYQLKLTGLENQYVGFDALGKAVAIDLPVGHLTREVVDALPAVDAASEEVIYILKTEDVDAGTVAYEEYVLVDGAFVKTSNEAVDLSGYQPKIVGVEGQHVVFDAAGELIAADMPEGHLTREVVDALPGVDAAAEDVVYILKATDPDTAAVSYQEWVFVEGAFVQTSGAAVDLSGKQDVLTGTETQFIGFDADGKAVAREISEIVDEAKTYTDEQINLAAHLKREIVTVDPTTLADTNEHTIYMFKVDSATGADVYQEWMVIDGAMTLIGDTSTTIDLSGKQDVLAGTEGQLVGFDAAGAAVAVTPDAVPTEDSVLPITSGAVYEALANIDVLPAGTEGQYIGFDATGAAVAVDLPEGHLVREVVDALPNAADADETVVYILKTVDADSGEPSYEQYQLIDGAMALVGHELPDMSGYQA